MPLASITMLFGRCFFPRIFLWAPGMGPPLASKTILAGRFVGGLFWHVFFFVCVGCFHLSSVVGSCLLRNHTFLIGSCFPGFSYEADIMGPYLLQKDLN